MTRKARGRMSAWISRRTWESLAGDDAWNAVLTTFDGSVLAADPSAREAFYRSGEEYADRILRAVHSYFGADIKFDTAADFGCGVGRVVVPLARHCRTVIGVDVSPTMLSMAEARVRRVGMTNVSFETLADFVASDQPFDLLHSVLVLQHIWPDEGLRILATLIPRTRPGGMIVLHVPYWVGGKLPRRLFRWARTHVPGFNEVANVFHRMPAKTPFMQMNAYDLNQLIGLIHNAGFADLVLLPEREEEARGVVILGRRL